MIGDRGAPRSAGLNVELLPGHLAVRWGDLGLRFAMERDLEGCAFVDTLIEALALVRISEPVHGTVAGMCRSLHPLIARDGETDVSFSDPALPFSVFVSCPPAGARDRVARLAESLVHEALHLQLSLVEKVEPLVAEDGRGTQAYSPWKGEERSLQGLVHAVYVFGNLRRFWNDVAGERPAVSRFARTRARTIDREMEHAAHLASSRFLTASGRRMAASFLASRDSGPDPGKRRGTWRKCGGRGGGGKDSGVIRFRGGFRYLIPRKRPETPELVETSADG